MKIAIYNAFPFHYEMYGYLIEHCQRHSYSLTIYHPYKDSVGIIEWYDSFFTHPITYKSPSEFKGHKYDVIFLLTDDDPSYPLERFKKKTISIDHHYLYRNKAIYRLATRPFGTYYRNWILPFYASYIDVSKKQKIVNTQSKDEIHILIIGQAKYYVTERINRLRDKELKRPIHIHAVSRFMDASKFSNLESRFKLHTYAFIEHYQLVNLLQKCHYLMLDTNISTDYEDKTMSGAVPLAFIFLIPLIISIQSNQYYQFKNVITYSKELRTPIDLYPISFESIEIERQKFIQKGDYEFETLISKIRSS